MGTNARARLWVGVSALVVAALAAPEISAQEQTEAPTDQKPKTEAADKPAAKEGRVEKVTVTAQRKKQKLQDVPIAVTALSEEDITVQKIEGGPDLLKAVPNVAFTKTNFTSYNFSIRGVGTQAISATTDPAVAVAFNNTTLIQNRLFEQEYFDIQRIEVLRGPQGTLYGRNATAGVVNVISAQPDLTEFSGSFRAEAGNFESRRLVGMLNLPIVDDVLGVRFAGAMTQREGYDYNSITQNAVNGRNLWSARATVAFEPTDNFRANFIFERFNEDDDRSRTGKQLCHRDPGLTTVGGQPVHVHDPNNVYDVVDEVLGPALFSQGCKPGSLYTDEAFGTPNGLALPIVFGVEILGYGDAFPIGLDSNGRAQALLRLEDPYGGMMQSRDLREIASLKDPHYNATADLFQLNVEFDLSDTLTLYSQTAYVDDTTYSFQDFNRFNTVPVFQDTSQMQPVNTFVVGDWRNLAPGGVFCDPQLGCTDTMVGFDIAKADATQFNQEFRLASAYDGPFNFSIGANYTKFDVLVDYYIMSNILTASALMAPFNAPVNGNIDWATCGFTSFLGPLAGDFGPTPATDPLASCPYIDPNPVESINGEGHNYFRSKNPYRLNSWAGFGEAYWQAAEDLRFTLGLRYNHDEKTFIPTPSQILLAPGLIAGGTTAIGYPELDPIVQTWGEWTGRFVADWKPDLSFTDDTMLYASFARGYKGGGANPPKPGFATADDIRRIAPVVADLLESQGFPLPILQLNSDEYADTFEAEFVNAYELGMKNTLFDGGLRLNATAFYYDYKDYQVSQVRDRTAVNENFDATSWGLELETLFAPSERFQMVANMGYLDTRIADGERSIDIMNRTQGDPNYTLVKAWLQLPSNCVIPTDVARAYLQSVQNVVQGQYWQLCGGLGGLLGAPFLFPLPTDPSTGQAYDFDDYPELNGGAGLYANLGGNELPNAPHWTINIGAQYMWPLFDTGWKATVRGDAYWQSQSWARVYNADPYDKLHGWYNTNISLWFDSPDENTRIEIYVKNALDHTPITGAFLNSDDTGLTTNIFTLDPRIIGVRATQQF